MAGKAIKTKVVTSVVLLDEPNFKIMNYAEKLKDPRWQKKRLDVFNRDQFTCQHCLDKTKTLHVHHLAYVRGNDPWDYDMNYLITLCEDCHTAIEDQQQEQCENLLLYFKINLKDTFIRNCCIDLFKDSKNLHDMIYLIWEYQRNNKEEELMDFLTKNFNK